MDLAPIDQVRLNFSPASLHALNAVIGLMMFGMAIIAGLWGIWHIVSGLTLALLFSRSKLPEPVGAPA